MAKQIRSGVGDTGPDSGHGVSGHAGTGTDERNEIVPTVLGQTDNTIHLKSLSVDQLTYSFVDRGVDNGDILKTDDENKKLEKEYQELSHENGKLKADNQRLLQANHQLIREIARTQAMTAALDPAQAEQKQEGDDDDPLAIDTGENIDDDEKDLSGEAGVLEDPENGGRDSGGLQEKAVSFGGEDSEAIGQFGAEDSVLGMGKTHTEHEEKHARVSTRPGEYGDANDPSLNRSGSKGKISKEKLQKARSFDVTANVQTLEDSAMTLSLPVQICIYSAAVGLILFSLIAPSQRVGLFSEEDGGEGSSRRLGGGGAVTAGDISGQTTVRNIAYCMVGAGAVAFLMHILKQPLLLGYILGGVLVGPIGLQLIVAQAEIHTISELGLILLLFMIGLELDVGELLKMGKVVILTGLLQFPICAGLQIFIFTGLSSVLSFGEGQFSTMYVGMCCGISSTMIVVKLLSEKMETDTAAGRLTIGVLIFQDIWAIIMLAIQPNLANPEIVGILKTFGLIAGLIVVALQYAKYVLPAVLTNASKVIELMLVLSLTWCFFICCVAILPFVQLSMELAALIAGVSMATFPYSAEFNGKLKYIRDFFITLYFVGLGMQIPLPTGEVIGIALIVGIVVLMCRWLGLFCVIYLLGGGPRLAVIPTVNLSEVSEFALVICSLGKGFGHVDDQTMVILIWTFSFLAVGAAYLIGGNHAIYHKMEPCLAKICRSSKAQDSSADGHGHDEDHEERDILFLGFYTLASFLIREFESHCPKILGKIHVVDVDTSLEPRLKKKNITFAYGDISARDVLEHCHHGRVSLVVCTKPDSFLKGTTNAELLNVARSLWPEAHVIVCADTLAQTQDLYANGAAYVLNRVKLGAERLATLIYEHETVLGGGGQIKDLMKRQRDDEEEQAGARKGSLVISR